MIMVPGFLLMSVLALEPPVLDLALDRRDLGWAVTDLRSGRTLGVVSDQSGARLMRLDLLRSRHGEGAPNLTFPTLGGCQWWGDRCWYGGWRIQEHVATGHCRLIDAQDRRRAWGSYAACRTALEANILKEKMSPPSGRMVILVHGLGRSWRVLAAMESAIRASGATPIRFSYPSTRQEVEAHAHRLRDVIDGLAGCDQVSFVTHSLGALVVREALAEPRPGWPRLHRVVFCFAPNQGSAIADRWHEVAVYRWLLGPAGQQVTTDIAPGFPIPAIPVACIAGLRDGKVQPSETMLPGMKTWRQFDVGHTFGASDQEVLAATLEFLAGDSVSEP